MITLFPTQNRKRRRPADVTPEEQQGIDELTPTIDFNFFADPADRADEDGEAVQTQTPQPVGEPEYHAAPEEDIAVSIATGEEPEEEEVEPFDPLVGLDGVHPEVSELVRLARDGLQHVQALLARTDICTSCGAIGDHGTLDCRVHPANPEQIALGVGLLDSFFDGFRPPQRGSLQRSTDMEVDQGRDLEPHETAEGADPSEPRLHGDGRPASISSSRGEGGANLPRDPRPPLPRIHPTTSSSEGQGTVPSPTVEPVSTARPKAKAMHNRGGIGPRLPRVLLS